MAPRQHPLLIPEIGLNVAQYLPEKNVKSASQVSKGLREIFEPELWRNIVIFHDTKQLFSGKIPLGYVEDDAMLDWSSFRRNSHYIREVAIVLGGGDPRDIPQ